MKLKFLKLLTITLVLWQCKDKVEGDAVASFELGSDVVMENNNVVLVNTSKNAQVFTWKVIELGLTYTGETPNIKLDSVGTFNLELEAKGGNGSISTTKKIITVTMDTFWRICNNSNKSWIIKSITYNGQEQMSEACKKDDILIFKHHPNLGVTDSFELTEGAINCPSGSYLFSMPSSGIWQFNTKTRAIDMALEVLGSPVNLNLRIDLLTKNNLKATDSGNKATIELVR